MRPIARAIRLRAVLGDADARDLAGLHIDDEDVRGGIRVAGDQVHSSRPERDHTSVRAD